MVQLVFVHGVANRNSAGNQSAIKNRNKLFGELLFTGRTVDFHAPMWGQFVPDIPQDVFETDAGVRTFSLNVGSTDSPAGMGGGLTGEDGSASAAGAEQISIGAIGKQDPVAALDAICSEIADQAAHDNRELKDEELEAFRKAAELIASNGAKSVFVDDAGAEAIAGQLSTDKDVAFGGFADSISAAVSAVTDRVRNAASTLGFGAIRGNLSPAVGLFLGDVFVYLKQGAIREKIRDEVRAALITAHGAAKAGKGPLVIVGHSMGGVILVDMLADLASAGLPADFAVDALLTVGSQPGLFASLDLLAPNPPAGSKRRRPDCVRNWWNVFDPIDPLAFRTDTLFKDAVDFMFNSVTGITEAHSKYFQRPQFYARSRKHLQDVGVL